MDWLSQLDTEKFLLFTLVLSRVSGLMTGAPIYGTNDTPMQVRALLAVTVALLIAPTQWNVAVEHPGTMINYLVFIGSELLIGLSLALGVKLLFTGIHLAGLILGRIGGIMLADVFDPNTESEVPTFAQLMYFIAIAVFVCIGGHRMVMAGLLDTFATIPPGSAAFPTSIANTFVEVVTESFRLGIRASVPVATALLLSTLVMGLISRTLPQLNVLMLGFGMNAMLTFAVMALTLGATVWAFQEQVEPILYSILDALHAPVQTEWMG